MTLKQLRRILKEAKRSLKRQGLSGSDADNSEVLLKHNDSFYEPCEWDIEPNFSALDPQTIIKISYTGR